MNADDHKRAAGEAAAELVDDTVQVIGLDVAKLISSVVVGLK